jgi:hypothetical protein
MSYNVVREFLNFYGSSMFVVRAAKDDSTSANSVLIVNKDCESLAAFDSAGTEKNGADQIRKMNDDDDDPSITFLDLTTLTLSGVVGSFSVGETVTGAPSGATGVVNSIDSTGNVLYLKDVSGTFAGGDTVTGGTSGATGTFSSVATGDDQVLMFFAKYPGASGNDIKVALSDSTNFSSAIISGSTTFAEEFESTPSTNEYAIAVLYNDTIVEKWIVSNVSGALNDQNRFYFFEDFLEENSEYIGAIARETGTYDITDLAGSFVATVLSGGASAKPTTTEAQSAYDIIFADEENDIRIVGDYHDLASADIKTVSGYIKGKAELSKRHLTIHSIPTDIFTAGSSFAIGDVTTYLSGLTGSSYVAVYDQYKKMYDKDTKRRYFIPVTGDMMGVIVQAVENNNWWTAPAGTTNGRIQNVESFYHKTTVANRDLLYKNGVNSLFYKRRKGYLVWGQKTTYTATSSKSRINVRLNLIDLELTMQEFLEDFIFSNPGEDQRRQIRNALDDGYLKRKSGEGAFDADDGDGGYRLTCDLTNNTPAKRNAYTTVVDVAVKPSTATEYIELNIVISKSGVNLEEL